MHMGEAGTGEPPDDGEMNEMTIPAGHRIQNSRHSDPRQSTLLLGRGCFSQY